MYDQFWSNTVADLKNGLLIRDFEIGVCESEGFGPKSVQCTSQLAPTSSDNDAHCTTNLY